MSHTCRYPAQALDVQALGLSHIVLDVQARGLSHCCTDVQARGLSHRRTGCVRLRVIPSCAVGHLSVLNIQPINSCIFWHAVDTTTHITSDGCNYSIPDQVQLHAADPLYCVHPGTYVPRRIMPTDHAFMLHVCPKARVRVGARLTLAGSRTADPGRTLMTMD